MKLIPVTFKLNGFDYNLLERKNNVALYSQSKKSESSGEYKVFGYEVHKVRKIVEVSRTKKHYKEVLARDDFKDVNGNWVCEFGVYGWTYNTKEDALKKYEELLKEQ